MGEEPIHLYELAATRRAAVHCLEAVRSDRRDPWHRSKANAWPRRQNARGGLGQIAVAKERHCPVIGAYRALLRRGGELEYVGFRFQLAHRKVVFGLGCGSFAADLFHRAGKQRHVRLVVPLKHIWSARYLMPQTLAGNMLGLLPKAALWQFGIPILQSSMHMAWTRYTCGRLKSDFQYSISIVYNNIPWPEFTQSYKANQPLASADKVQAAI